MIAEIPLGDEIHSPCSSLSLKMKLLKLENMELEYAFEQRHNRKYEIFQMFRSKFSALRINSTTTTIPNYKA
ncbi:hypothetical protein RHGRI_032832 [Rhododendron griersonianum]|uniref:Uncharacterized protein n=1 Tax=Rhododendron griersonianum TaxID=479676 RepID=A0AAV6IDI6_9ERIC|nr:hypothetical protein RHGRI_032832 [Rhododendron griersonianum]